MSIATRILGKTGLKITILGLGGEGILRTFGREKEAYALTRQPCNSPSRGENV
jgi:hypothetical protein